MQQNKIIISCGYIQQKTTFSLAFVIVYKMYTPYSERKFSTMKDYALNKLDYKNLIIFTRIKL